MAVINPGIGHLTEKTELPIGEYRLEKEVTHADFITFDQKKIDDRLLSLQRRDENTYSLIERKGFLRMHLKKQKLTEKTDAQYFGCGEKIMILLSACMEFVRSGKMNRRGSSAIRIMQIIFRCASAVEREEKAAGNRTYNRKRYAACGRRNQCKRNAGTVFEGSRTEGRIFCQR